ncbi:MAG: DUF1924 domain-containing protein [Rhodospirillales bacterium]|nr:DUF1924 domain-containing protein [Rhodospirillales bacterium]
MLLRGIVVFTVGVCLFGGIAAAEPARDAILADYLNQARQADPGFTAFSAERGEALFKARHAHNPDVPSCTTCHTEDPTRQGRHYKTGRAIEPVAVSRNPERFTDATEVEKRFSRDCKNVLGRLCTAVEKGDYVTFMMSR